MFVTARISSTTEFAESLGDYMLALLFEEEKESYNQKTIRCVVQASLIGGLIAGAFCPVASLTALCVGAAVYIFIPSAYDSAVLKFFVDYEAKQTALEQFKERSKTAQIVQWSSIEYKRYSGDVPTKAREAVERIKNEVPDAKFVVHYPARIRSVETNSELWAWDPYDPYLSAQVDGQTIYFYHWL